MDTQIPAGQLVGDKAGKPRHRELAPGVGSPCSLRPDPGRVDGTSGPSREFQGLSSRVGCPGEGGRVGAAQPLSSGGCVGRSLETSWDFGCSFPSPPPVLAEVGRGRWRIPRGAEHGLEGHQVKVWEAGTCLPDPPPPPSGCGDLVVRVGTCVCLCRSSSSAELELGWGLGLSHLPSVSSGHLVQGWE